MSPFPVVHSILSPEHLADWVYYVGLQAGRYEKISNFYLSENYLKMFIGRVKGSSQ